MYYDSKILPQIGDYTGASIHISVQDSSSTSELCTWISFIEQVKFIIGFISAIRSPKIAF